MKNSWFATLYVLIAPVLDAQRNDMPLNNGAELLVELSNPTVGAPLLASKSATDDLFWRVYSGDRVLCYTSPAGASTMVIDGYCEGIYATDWSSPPDFYDRLHGPALASILNPGNREPAFFQLGFATEVLVSLGNCGLPDPCLSFPALCVGAAPSCPSGVPAGAPASSLPESAGGQVVNGWLVEIQIQGAGIEIPSDGTAASDHAVTYFPKGGMSSPGPCPPAGDYVYQASYSTDETQADRPATGISEFSGRQVSPGPRVPDPVTHAPAVHVTFREPVLNMVADSGTGSLEVSKNGGGALNALKLPTSTGSARIASELRSARASQIDIAFVGSSLTPLSHPGFPVFGGTCWLLFLPDAVTTYTVSAWTGMFVTLSATLACSPRDDFVFNGTPLPVPAGGTGLSLYSQGFILHTVTFTFSSTNRVRTSLH